MSFIVEVKNSLADFIRMERDATVVQVDGNANQIQSAWPEGQLTTNGMEASSKRVMVRQTQIEIKATRYNREPAGGRDIQDGSSCQHHVRHRSYLMGKNEIGSAERLYLWNIYLN